MINSFKLLLALCTLTLIGATANAQLVAHPTSDRSVEVIVDKLAQPEYNWNEYLVKTLKYPTDARDKKQQGKVVVEMKVDTDGSIKDIRIVRGAHTSLNEEAFRVVKNAPKWQPAMKDKQAVASYLTVPIVFKM